GTTLAINNDPVRQWNDLSGHGYHMSEATSAQRPTYLSAGYNSKPALSFLGTASPTRSDLVTAVGVAISGTPFSCFAVCQMTTNTQNNGRLFAYTGPSGA